MHAVPLEARRGCWVPLERELQMAVSYHVGAGNQTAAPLEEQPELLTYGPSLQVSNFNSNLRNQTFQRYNPKTYRCDTGQGMTTENIKKSVIHN